MNFGRRTNTFGNNSRYCPTIIAESIAVYLTYIQNKAKKVLKRLLEPFLTY
jgi:hypothetical protein